MFKDENAKRVVGLTEKLEEKDIEIKRIKQK